MERAQPRHVLPGPIRQNGYVVRDLERAIDGWLGLGVGPWLLLPDVALSGLSYRGQPAEPVISMAFANSGDLQVELIAQEDDSPSIFREFLDGGQEGFHHLAWWTEEFPSTSKAATDAGWELVQGGNVNGMAEFAYYQPDPGTTVVEVMELNDATRWLASTVSDAAREWDGTDPVRRLA